MYDNYYDDTHPLKPWTFSIPADPRSSAPAINAVRGLGPEVVKDHWPCWDGERWIQIEDHRGAEGYIGDEPITISELGPLPDGWSTTPPEASLEEIKAGVVGRINHAFETACSTLKGDDPPSASSTYTEQRTEAEAWAADNTAPTPMLDALAAARHIEKAELVRRVLEKAALFKQASGLLLGQQQALMDDVNAIMADDGLSDALKIVALQELPITIGLPN